MAAPTRPPNSARRRRCWRPVGPEVIPMAKQTVGAVFGLPDHDGRSLAQVPAGPESRINTDTTGGQAARARRWSRTATSSSSGRAPPGRKRFRGLRPAVRGVGCDAGRRATCQHLHDGYFIAACRSRQGGGGIRRGLEERPRTGGPRASRASATTRRARHRRRVPGQHLHVGRPVPPATSAGPPTAGSW